MYTKPGPPFHVEDGERIEHPRAGENGDQYAWSSKPAQGSNVVWQTFRHVEASNTCHAMSESFRPGFSWPSTDMLPTCPCPLGSCLEPWILEKVGNQTCSLCWPAISVHISSQDSPTWLVICIRQSPGTIRTLARFEPNWTVVEAPWPRAPPPPTSPEKLFAIRAQSIFDDKLHSLFEAFTCWVVPEIVSEWFKVETYGCNSGRDKFVMNGAYACYSQQSLPHRHSCCQLIVVVSQPAVSNCVTSYRLPIKQPQI